MKFMNQQVRIWEEDNSKMAWEIANSKTYQQKCWYRLELFSLHYYVIKQIGTILDRGTRNEECLQISIDATLHHGTKMQDSVLLLLQLCLYIDYIQDNSTDDDNPKMEALKNAWKSTTGKSSTNEGEVEENNNEEKNSLSSPLVEAAQELYEERFNNPVNFAQAIGMNVWALKFYMHGLNDNTKMSPTHIKIRSQSAKSYNSKNMKIEKKQRRPVWSNKEQQEIWSSFLCARAYTLFLKRSRSKEEPALIDRILEGEEVEVEPANGAGEEVEVEPANGAPAAASDEPEVQDPANGTPAAASDEPEVEEPANGTPAAASDEPEDQDPANGAPAAASDEPEVQDPANGTPAAASDEPEVQDPANGTPAAASDEPEVQDPANGTPAAASDDPEDQDTANGAPAAASDEPEVQDPANGTPAAASDDPEDQDT